MSYKEKSTWIMLRIPMLVYAGYLTQILSRADGGPLSDVPYAGAVLWASASWITLAIVTHIVVFAIVRDDVGEVDQRDREIGRFGEYVGQFVVVVAGVATLVMAIMETDHFWIGNAIYLAFVLSSVVGSGAKIHAYRRGHPPW